jgi:hypothetical protein
MAQLERPAQPARSTRLERPEVRDIGKVQPQERVAVTGDIVATAALSISGCPACRYTLSDGTGEVDLLFLGRIAVAGLDVGRRCTAEGTATARDGRIVIWNPRYLLQPDSLVEER